MTQEEKKLLLKDLCARLPYGVKISFLNGTTPWTLTGMFESEYNGTMLIMLPPNPPKHSSPKTTNLPMKDCKPYLRPMSSMTDEERREFYAFGTTVINHTNANREECSEYRVILTSNINQLSEIMDWLNKHYLDYRGLIPMGLALEALEGMYNFKNE